MTSDEEKNKLSKLLQALEVQEIKLPKRCTDLLKDIGQKYSEVDNEMESDPGTEVQENPYRVDSGLLEDIDRKLSELLHNNKSSISVHHNGDIKKPWRTNSNKEKLLRIDCDLKRHLERGSEMIVPLSDGEMKDLVKDCFQKKIETPVHTVNKLRDTVEAARRDLPNFQYRKIGNSTATEIIQEIHDIVP